jgi:predicted MFS family arabinose efflux permease
MLLSHVQDAGCAARARGEEGTDVDAALGRNVTPVFRVRVLAPFQFASFRLQWPADLLTSCAFEMETLILGWYVLVATNSVLLLTLFGALQFTGTLVAPLFGVAGDRIGHRNLLCGMRLCYTMLSTTLMCVALAGTPSPASVLILTALMGLVRPSDLGVRSALIADSMPTERLVAALGISRTTSDMARVVGALGGAGLFAAFGLGAAYIVVASFYAVGLLLTAAIGNRSRGGQADAAGVAPRPSAWSDLRAGLAYVRARPQLLAPMWLAFLVNLTAYPLSSGLLPYVAREIYLIDQTGLGYLAASFATGALLGSMAVSQRSSIRPGRAMILATLAWYLALLAFVRVTSPFAGVVMLMLAGFAQSFCMVTLAVLLMRTTSAPFRGRVMGVRMLVIYGLPIGLPAAGALIDLVGFHATATLYASVGLACTLLIALTWRSELWPAQAPANARQ